MQAPCLGAIEGMQAPCLGAIEVTFPLPNIKPAGQASELYSSNYYAVVVAKFKPGDFSGTTTDGTVRKARTASPGKSGPKRKLGDADMAKKIKFIGDASNKDYITCRAHNANGKTVKVSCRIWEAWH